MLDRLPGTGPRLVHSRPKAAIALRVGEEDTRVLPARSPAARPGRPGWARRSGCGCAGRRSALCSRPNSAVVDQLVLLALAQRLDGQPQLLLDLVHRLVVEVGDPAVHPQHGLRHAQLVLARSGLVVDEGAGQGGLADVPGGQLQRALAVARCAAPVRPRARSSRWARSAADRSSTCCERLAGEGEDGAAGQGAQGEGPLPRLLGGQVRVADEGAVGQHVQHRLLVVLAGPRCSSLPCASRTSRSAGLPCSAMTSPGPKSRCRQRFASSSSTPGVLEAAQQRQFTQLGRDDAHLGAGGDELDAAVAERVGEPPVDPEGAAADLHPGQHPQQPPRGDPLHLRGGLGGGRQVPCGRGPERERGRSPVRRPIGCGMRRSGHG